MPDSFKRFSTVFSSGWIDIDTSRSVNEVMSRAQKLQVERRLMAGDGFARGIVFETLLKDSLHTVNVQQFKVQRSLTCRIEPGRAVAFGQADKLFCRTEPAPAHLTAHYSFAESP